MNFFDGDPRRRRDVNLGGASRSKTASRTAVVDDTRAQRAQRELEQRQHRSARKIQSFYKGRAAVRKAQRAVLPGFESDFAVAKNNVPRAPQILDLTRRFNFLGLNDKHANKRVAEFFAWLAKLVGPPSTVNADILKSELGKRWVYQVKRAAELAVECLRREAIKSSGDIATMKGCLNFLLVSTDPKIWPDAFSKDQAPSRATLLSHLIQIDTYAVLRLILGMTSKDPSLDTLAMQLAFRLLDPESDASLQQFSLAILALPSFDSLPKATLDFLGSTLPYDRLASALSTASAPTKEDGARLLASLTLLLSARVATLPAQTVTLFLGVLQRLVHTLPRAAFTSQDLSNLGATSAASRALNDDDDDDDDEMEIDQKPAKTSAFAKPAEPSFDPKLRRRLAILTEPEFLRSIAKRAAEPSFGTQGTTAAGLFFLELATRSKASRDQVLTVVAAVPAVIRQFWKTAKQQNLGPKFLKGHATEADKNALAGLLGPLSGGYSRRLVTMDDADFVSGESRGVFILSDVVELSALLRDICVNLHLAAKLPGEVGERLVALRREATAVLRDLHDWDARKSFCPPDHWVHATVDIRVDSLPLTLFDIPDEDVMQDESEDSGQMDHGRLTSSQSANVRSVQLLRHLPFVIPFSGRVRLFQRLLDQDINSRINSYEQVMGSVVARVRRPYLYEDGFERLSTETTKLKGRIRIQLIDEHGLEEAGIDGGGLFKEFLTELIKKGFDPSLGFFKETSQNLLYPNPESMAFHGPEALLHYEFLGKMVGKAVYERILVELPLAQFFLRKMLKRPCSIADLASLDEDLSRHLLQIKNYAGDFADLGLTFSVTESNLGSNRTIDLIPNGRNVDVTAQNRLQFVYLMANYRLNVSIRAQCEAFLRGVQTLIEPAWLQMFDERELQVLISGAEMPVDVDDLRRNTVYSGGYSQDHPTIATFWEVVRGLDDSQRRKLLKFATSCSRPPLLGFKELVPKFCIHSAGRESADRLPTASTCMNLLKLPEFKDKNTMKTKLVYAIEAGAGFDLS